MSEIERIAKGGYDLECSRTFWGHPTWEELDAGTRTTKIIVTEYIIAEGAKLVQGTSDRESR